MKLTLRNGKTMHISDLDEVMGTPLVKQIDYKRSHLSREIRETLYQSLEL